MISWQVECPNRLLNEVKRKFSGIYTTKQVRWSIEHNRCFVNYRMERFGSTALKKGDQISIEIAQLPTSVDQSRICFEDACLLVYDKMPFVPSEQIAKQLSAQLVHRLDRDTSGLLILAKTAQAQYHLEAQFKNRTIAKEYLALVQGVMHQEKGTITAHMAPHAHYQGGTIWKICESGLWSQTTWSKLHQFENYSLLSCKPLTGRTHQIRVHLSYIGHPILGDPLYGKREQIPAIFRPLLHAYRLHFHHPLTEKAVSLTAPIPADFSQLCPQPVTVH